MPAESRIPTGYGFINPSVMMSDKAKAIFEGWAKDVENRNPDNFDMYIYNDFYWFGQLELMETALRKINYKITKKAHEDAFTLLEALIVLNTVYGSWPMANDAELVELTDMTIGSFLERSRRALEGVRKNA